MIIQSKLVKIFKKEPKQICMTIGGIYAGFGTFAFFIMTMQKLMMSNIGTQPDESFTKLMTTLHDIWSIYMPLMILLGLIYVGFGLMFNKIKTNKFKINRFISFLSLGWVVSYTISSFEFIKLFSTTTQQDFEFFGYIIYVFAGLGFLVVFGMFTIPQYMIGKKIKNIETEERKNAI